MLLGHPKTQHLATRNKNGSSHKPNAIWAQQPPFKSFARTNGVKLLLLSFMKRWEEATPIKVKRQEPRSRGLMPHESHAISSRTRTRATQSRNRTRACQSRGLKPEWVARINQPCTITYTRNTKPWSLKTGVARIKPLTYNHVNAQHKAVVPLQQESHASPSRRSTQSICPQLSQSGG